MTKIYEINSKKYGKVEVLLDDEDYDRVIKERYSLTASYDKTIHGFYIKFTRNPNGYKTRILSRYITNCPDGLQVDHINHDTLDNRKSNLRVCTQLENQQNKRNNTSGKVGVWHHTRDDVYIAMAGRKELGRSKIFSEAVKLREDWEKNNLRGGD